MHVCTKCHGNPSSSHQYISLNAKNDNKLMITNVMIHPLETLNVSTFIHFTAIHLIVTKSRPKWWTN